MDRALSFQELAKVETSLLLRKLEQHCQAAGILLPELDKRIATQSGYHALLFSGQIVLRLEDIFAILYVIREDPGTFFAEVLPPNDQGSDPNLRYGLRPPS